MECPLCDGPTEIGELNNRDGTYTFRCSQCGDFLISRDDHEDYLPDRRKREKSEAWKLSCLTREQTAHHRRPLFVVFSDRHASASYAQSCEVIDVNELRHRWPEMVSARMIRALINLAHLSDTAGQKLKTTELSPPLLFSRDADEAGFMLDALCSQGWLQAIGNEPSRSYVVTAKGWATVEQESRTRDPVKKPPFVAMWFGGKNLDDQARMTTLLTEAIIPAVEGAGYLAPIRIDRSPHNEWIVDRIMACIREAPFVVADLTDHNLGVYWEAGFARGLGVPVVHCCPDEQGKDTHFDLQQVSQVRYSTPGELRERLRDRILGSIGPGPFAR